MKLKIDPFVNRTVKMTTMAPRIKSELLESRRICLKTFKKECDWGCDCTATNVDRKEADNGSVRVGSPFLHQPITIDRFSPTHDNLQLLEAVKRLLKFKVEKCCNNLIAHYVDLYLHGDKVKEMERFVGRYYTPSRSLADDLKKQIQFQIWSAFNLGKHDGFEDGRRMMQIILGHNPADTCWRPIVKKDDDQKKPSKTTKLPVKLESPSERHKNYIQLLDRTLSVVQVVEVIIMKLVKFRLRLFLLGRKPSMVKMDTSCKQEVCVGEKLDIICDRVYRLGHFSGFESGQAYTRIPYSEVWDDFQTYTLLDNNQDNWLVVDRNQTSDCSCMLCPQCIRAECAPNCEESFEAFMVEERLKVLSKELKRVNDGTSL